MNIPGHGHLGPQNKRHEDSTDTVTFFISSPLGGGAPSQVAERDR